MQSFLTRELYVLIAPTVVIKDDSPGLSWLQLIHMHDMVVKDDPTELVMVAADTDA